MSGTFLDVIHVVVGLACFVAAFRVIPSFQAIIYLNPVTAVTGTAFFVLTGILQLGLAAHNDSGWLLVGAAYLQAISIVTFLIFLAADLQRALKRLRLAFMAIRHHYQKDGDRVIATVTTALQGKDSRVRSSN